MKREAPRRTPLGASVRSWLGQLQGTAYMPFVITSYATAYSGAGGIAKWNTDYARWTNIINAATTDGMIYDAFHAVNFMAFFKVAGGYQTSPPGDVNPPYSGDPIPYSLTNLLYANGRIHWMYMPINGFGGLPSPTLSSFLQLYGYRGLFSNGTYVGDPLPRHVDFYVQNDAIMSKADFDPGYTDFKEWLDDHDVSYKETEDTFGGEFRWLDWLCDYYDEKY